MKLAPLCILLLLTAALATACCSTDNDIVTAIADNSAGIHDDLVFPADCRPPQMFVPNGTTDVVATRTAANGASGK